MGKGILIIGENLHNVGYRPLLLAIASSLGIKNFFADNVEIENRQAIEILIGEKEESFLDFIKKKKPRDAIISEIKTEDYSGFIMDIESYSRYLTGEQLAKIAGYGRMMISEIKEVGEKVDKTGKELGEKIDNVGDKVDSVGEKVEAVGEKVDSVAKGIDELKTEHIKTRELSHEIFYTEVQELRKELSELKASVEEIKKKVGIG